MSDKIETVDPVRTEFRVPECNIDRLRERIAKLARKAEKLKLEPLVLEEYGHEDVPLAYVLQADGSGTAIREFNTVADATADSGWNTTRHQAKIKELFARASAGVFRQQLF